jgi:cysteine desulfurase
LKSIYLDHAASSPIRPVARDVVLGCWESGAANTMSSHSAGGVARAALALAREQVAALVGARPGEVVFTAGATEASNLAIRGHAQGAARSHLIATRIEHSATRRACEALAREGWAISLLSPDAAGLIAPADLARALTPATRAVSVIGGHNELGTVQPLVELAEVAHSHGALFHVDAVQAAGTRELAGVPWDLLSLSAHKLGGPQGIGALVVRGDRDLSPVLVGGPQEGGLRPGTVPVALAAGFGAAAAAALANRSAERTRLAGLRDRLAAALRDRFPGSRPLGCWAARPDHALPHILTLGFAGWNGDEIVWMLDQQGVCASSSSACLGDARSHVMAAIGLPDDVGVLRLSLGWSTTDLEIDQAIARISAALEALSRMSAFDRRRGPFAAKAAEAGIVLTAAHLAAAEAVYGFHRREQILPGPRFLARVLGNGTQLDRLFPEGLATLARWLGLPLPGAGCGPSAV